MRRSRPDKLRVTRIGREPVVLWERDEETDLPRFTLFMQGWRFKGPDRALMELGTGGGVGTISATVIRNDDDEPLVPSDPEPDIEHGFVELGGYTLTELREMALGYR
jgi:hypothetical protein